MRKDIFMKRIALTAVTVLLCLSASAYDPDAVKFKDGPHAGFSFGGDVRSEDFAWGWQAAYEYSDWLSMEASITAQNDELEQSINDVVIPQPFGLELDVYALAFSARAGIRPWSRLHLYALAGAGYYIMKTDAEEARVIIAGAEPAPSGVRLSGLTVDVENSFGLHAGAGLEIRLSERWEIFAEFRQVFLEADADLKITEEWPSGVPNNPRMMQTRMVDDKLPYDHSLVRAGVSYRF